MVWFKYPEDEMDMYIEEPACYICAGSFYAPEDHYEYGTGVGWDETTSTFCSDFDMERRTFWKIRSYEVPYRMILFNPKDQKYYLSGAAEYPLEDRGHYIVPWDTNQAVIGRPKETELLAFPELARWYKDLEKSGTLSGYLVHQICWKRLSRFIGRDAETYLGTLSRVLRSRPNPLGPSSWPPNGIGFDDDPDTREELYAVQVLIQRSRSRFKKGIQTKISPLAVRSHVTLLPLEIQYQIMDHLRGRDAVRAKQQLGWTLPDSYWRTRIDTVRFYQIDYLPNEDRDWEYLCLRLESPVRTQEAYEEFMHTLHAIKSQFYRDLDKG